ncbi:MAG: hypothetical protein OdinLCB4_006130 [Candidatus Odinarchaeum yellowstonii]|uniref:Uncharacterized protein n=1 Tax=Odinarchaeota yellowstonii (strain LCB_4) TaxID=1841599 RepID=A0AAF0IBK2_ODILC|nr:MAG: hypothetical protein OdinLCB4_006130 [Candidatus Odinarchaeum yellowstonii]
MRKSEGLSSVLVKINERYNILKASYNQRMSELFNTANELDSNTGESAIKLAALLQHKIYLCSEIIMQFQNWLDDVQSLEVIDDIDKKLKILHSHIRNEVNKLDELQILVKDYFKTHMKENNLNSEVQKNLKNKIKMLAESKNETNKQLEEVYYLIFNKKNLLASLSEYV